MRSIGAGIREHELHGVVVDDLDFLDLAEQVGGAQIQLHRAVDGVLHGVRVERRPVVERDALAELEGPGEAVGGGGPLRGQTRRERLCAAGRVRVHQRLVAVGHVHDFRAVAGARVPRGDAVERGDAQDVRPGGGGRARRGRLRFGAAAARGQQGDGEHDDQDHPQRGGGSPSGYSSAVHTLPLASCPGWGLGVVSTDPLAMPPEAAAAMKTPWRRLGERIIRRAHSGYNSQIGRSPTRATRGGGRGRQEESAR